MRKGQNGCLLFCRTDWHSVDNEQKRVLQSEISSIDGNRFLNTSVDDLCNFFEDKFRIDIPELHEDRISVGIKETLIDVSQDRMRAIIDRRGPVYEIGTLIEVTIPFSGEANFFA